MSHSEPGDGAASPSCPHAAAAARPPPGGHDPAAILTTRLLRLYRSHPSPAPFREFAPGAHAAYDRVARTIGAAAGEAAAGDRPESELAAALARAESLIHDGEHPELVKYALGTFWTHSRAAQALRIPVPHVGEYRHFRSEAPVAPLFQDGAPLPPPPVVNHAYATITGDTFGPGREALLAYWREDFDFNDHHMHWHMVYPGGGYWDPATRTMENAIDRRGELFLWMHSQIISRYDNDRLCWGLPLTKAWSYDDVIEQEYHPVPGLADGYGARPPMKGWFTVRNPAIPDFDDAPVPIITLETWRLALLRAISDREVHIRDAADHTQRALLALDTTNMLDWIGNIVESAPLACSEIPGRPGWEIDSDVYGNLHNFGHDKFAEIGYHDFEDPLNPLDLMISNFGSPRESCFYPWHRHIATFRELASDQFPQDVAATAPPGVTVGAVVIEPIDPARAAQADGLRTTMGPPSLEFDEANAKLDHEPYQWRVTIECPEASAAAPVEVDVRLFVVADDLRDRRHAYIEMDRWPVTLTAPQTTLTRTDMDSSTVRKIENYAGSNTDKGYTSPWCLCGWPRNLMLPAGTPEGFPMQAFCCVTVPKLHRVAESDLETPAISYCGAQLDDRRYPDDLGMGYPFDRAWEQQLDPSTLTLSEVVAAQPHMRLAPFTITRSTTHYHGTTVTPDPDKIEWTTIHSFFRPMDVGCMRTEYGYDFNSEIDVTLHAAALYDALSHQRMPKDGAFWSSEQLDTFFRWMHQPVSADVHRQVAERALHLYMTHGHGRPLSAAG